MTEAVLTIAACTLAIGFALGWLCRVLVGEWFMRRDRRRPEYGAFSMVPDEAFRRISVERQQEWGDWDDTFTEARA